MTELWKHQIQAIELSKKGTEFALFMEMGTGKTRTMIEILKAKYQEHGKLLRTLIVAPQVTLRNWKNEFAKFSDITEENILILRGSGKERATALTQSCSGDGKIVVCNYETLLMKPCHDFLCLWRPDALIFDESHKLKNHAAIRSKKAYDLACASTYRYILTGTPILNSLIDIFQQYKVLDLGKTFGNNFYSDFRNVYFYNKNASSPSHVTWPDWRPRPSVDSLIQEMIFKKAFHVKKMECLDLPPLVKEKVFVSLGKEQKEYYEKMKKDFIFFIQGKACTGPMAVTKALRLQQIASGYIKLDTGAVIKIKDNPRRDAVIELLNDITPNHKVILWACFKENYIQLETVCNELKIPFVSYHGDSSTKERDTAIDDFNNKPEIRVFIGNPKAGGIGVNLTQASYTIYYTRNFSLEDDLQSEARNHRGGSEIHEKITRIDLVAENTIDEKIAEALANKQEISDKILKEMAYDI